MLSVLIPVYNTDVRKLAGDLHDQCRKLSIKSEIVFIDDGSVHEFRSLNREFFKNSSLRYIELDSNIGRAAIRNRLANEASYDWLLFLDCDSGLSSGFFIANYLACTEEKGVVCGGRIYGSASKGLREWRLHRSYGLRREQRSLKERSLRSFTSFMTNNFLIHRDLFNEVKFDEQIRDYGHEDTLFGYQLRKLKIPLIHIENPVEHVILQSNQEFLDKSMTAAANLARISFKLMDEEFVQSVSLLRFHAKLSHLGISDIVFRLGVPLRKLISELLVKGVRSLFFLDILKYLSFYEELRKLQTTNASAPDF